MITVIVSTRNRPEMIRRCVASICAGDTGPMAELIVVDQSTEPAADLEAVVGPETARDFSFRHILTDTVGVSISRNIGVAAAKQEIVAVTDDDCVVAPDWIANVAAAFAADPGLTGVCGRILPLGEGAPGLVPISVRLSEKDALFSPWVDPSEHGSGGNFAARKDAIEQVGGYDRGLGPGTAVPAAEDVELLYQMVRAGSRIKYDPAPTVHHESWRPEAELLGLGWNYAFGAAAYLTRQVVVKGDAHALKILMGRLIRWVWLWVGGTVLGKPHQRKLALRHLAGIRAAVWAVASLDASYGIDREWMRREGGRQ